MVQRFGSRRGRLQRDGELPTDCFLTYEVGQRLRPQRDVELFLIRERAGGHDRGVAGKIVGH
uniref:Unannotated protein n=1 Tax=freshwater metagenome TaxID=449393 RepID=A0A6J5ZZG9_9ZZZZ